MKRALLLLLLCSCGPEERSDFLIGRLCDEKRVETCDEGQRCLPHALENGLPEDWRCRDRASFEPRGNEEPPLAYCDPARNITCPGDLVCNADRIRVEVGARPLVCKRPDDVFAPPLDAGSGT